MRIIWIYWMFVHFTIWFVAVQSVYGVRHEVGVPASPIKERLVKRILGGHVSSPDQWPWMVSVRVRWRNGHMTCGGALIDDDWVITAAHCLEHGRERFELVSVMLGKSFWHMELREGRSLPVDKVIFHPLRQHRQMGKIGLHDIALLHMSESPRRSDRVIPLPLPRGDRGVNIGQVCSVAGWGREHVHSGASMFLKDIFLKVISNFWCSDILDMRLFPMQMCAMPDSGQASCKGDSGAPLVCRQGDELYLTGIVSFGTPCGLYPEPTPTVFTYVYPYTDWIHSTMKSFDVKNKNPSFRRTLD